MGSVWDWFGVGLGWVWGRFGIGLGPVWDRFGVGSGSVWARFGFGLGSVLGRFGVVLESFWTRFGNGLGSFWGRFWNRYRFGIVLGKTSTSMPHIPGYPHPRLKGFLTDCRQGVCQDSVTLCRFWDPFGCFFGSFWSVFGAKSHPGRLQDASRRWSSPPRGDFSVENGAARIVFRIPGKSKIAPKSHF